MVMVSTIYMYAYVGLNFQVLFKNLNVDIKEVKQTTLLKDKSRMTEGNPEFSQPKIVEEVKSTVRSVVNQVVLPADVAGPSYLVDLSQIPTVPASNIPNFQSVLKTNVLGFDLFHSHLLPMSMNKAIEELLSIVVERSVSIASQTEYINDPDEIYIDNVSSLMVASLAGNLSSVTCKEPLRVFMASKKLHKGYECSK
ncbi:putative CCR4-NOT transcription complex subunit 1 [Helianthus annuus]|uniref:CCR4-NOT transcription complex subunit 1 n=1 Tax=Helianthus annuus TaxID=4232 RepID=A0A9K3EKC3_HELAN|nr:putative CCR4-NOT transcription complex subunit 1 [Helianthus annuus]